MSIHVKIPAIWKKLTNNQTKVSIDGNTVGEIIENIEKAYPGIKAMIYDKTGKMWQYVNIFVNDEDIRRLNKEATEVKKTDEITILPSMGGGI